MTDFSKKNTKESGGKFGDRDWTFTNCRWDVVASTKSDFKGIYYISDLEGPDGKTEEKRWMLGDADKLKGKLRVEDGVLIDVDEDNPYVPRTNDETSQLFNSLEECGVSAKVLSKIGEEPGGLDGYTIHLVEKPTGRKQKKDGVETKYDQTWLVADPSGLVASPDGGKKTAGAKSAAKPTSAAGAKGKKGAPIVEEEEEDDEAEDTDPVEAAAVATIQAVLATPKKFVPTYNAKQNGGGLTLAQMQNAALGNAIPRKHREAGKPNVAKLMKKPDIYVQYDGELWNFDADEGIVTSID